MNAFFNYYYDLICAIGRNIWSIIKNLLVGIVELFNVSFYYKIFVSYKEKFGVPGWVMFVIATLIMLVVLVLLGYLLYRLIRRFLKFKQPIKENEELKDEITRLNHEMYKLSYERDKILALQVSNLGMEVNRDLLPVSEGDLNSENSDLSDGVLVNLDDDDPIKVVVESAEDDTNMRFNRLTLVDRYYQSEKYQKPEYNNDISLEDMCKDFRNFSASKLGLYYDLDLIKFFIAALGATKMIILQGISGTGKTSLAYAFGQYICRPSVICPVQPAWRDRTELFGYFNEFTKKFNETEFLKTIYEANYYEDMQVIVLDEMNIARVEYYFAEMLSILEMPRVEEREISIVSSVWPNDPEKLREGKLFISPNVWYIGTINNDDSTFAVADKVYDRAIPIDLDTKAARFDAPNTEPIHVTYRHVEELFEKAKVKYSMSEINKAKLGEVDDYVIKHFRMTFGNRILKQIYDFVPCYVACGGTEIDAIDFMLAKKILRKFSSLNLGYIRDEVDGFIAFLNDTFGYENMNISKEYLLRLKKLV